MKDLAIYGAGGFGREVACLVRYINQAHPTWNLIGFFDDGKAKGEAVSHFGKVLGNLADLNAWPTPLCLVIAIGSPASVKHVAEGVSNSLIEWPNLISPDFCVTDPETFSIGKGNVIQGPCAATTEVQIGDFNVFNGSVVIGHDTKIGNYNVFMPDIRVSGNVVIGDCNLFGVKSLILNGLKIGNHVTIGAGAVMLTKPKDGNTYLGNPAKIFKY